MKKNDLIKCCVASLNFLLFSDEEYEGDGRVNFMTPSNKNLTNILAKHRFDTWVDFTEFVSCSVLGYENPPWFNNRGVRNPARDFFSDRDKASKFFIDALIVLRAQDWIEFRPVEDKKRAISKF